MPKMANTNKIRYKPKLNLMSTQQVWIPEGFQTAKIEYFEKKLLPKADAVRWSPMTRRVSLAQDSPIGAGKSSSVYKKSPEIAKEKCLYTQRG